MSDGWQFLLIHYPHKASSKSRKLHYVEGDKMLCGSYGKLNLFKDPDIKTEDTVHNFKQICCAHCWRIKEGAWL